MLPQDINTLEPNMSKVLVIAEAGVNHNGDMKLAREMIKVAHEAGADFVKFQTFQTNKLVTKDALKANYQIEKDSHNDKQFEMLSALELTPNEHFELIKHCKEVGIGFLSTAFDLESLEFLNRNDVSLFKIPSGEITNLPYLRRVGQLGRDVVLSTGMSTLEEIGHALQAIESQGLNRERITVLHCTSAYPTPFHDVNLKAMISIRDEYNIKVGYSDHTLGIEVAIAAVALGATILEKHFTLDRGLVGPDHKASLVPDELGVMISAIRNIESALGQENKECQPSELPNLFAIRKSVVAATAIRKGEFFSDQNLTSKRPGGGISPMRWDEIVGQRSKRDYEADDLIEQ